MKANRYQQCRCVTDPAQRLGAARRAIAREPRSCAASGGKRPSASETSPPRQSGKRCRLHRSEQTAHQTSRGQLAPIGTPHAAVSPCSSSSATACAPTTRLHTAHAVSHRTKLAAQRFSLTQPSIIDASHAAESSSNASCTATASAPTTRLRPARAARDPFSRLSRRESWSAVQSLLR